MTDIRIGISGWTYAPWRGTFFPKGLRQADELAFASRQVSTIEINGTFYSLQRPSSYRTWRAETPDNFVFSVKGPRFITHLKRLKDPLLPLANFFASGVLELREKLGPFLWQLPPSFQFDPARLTEFFKLLPRTHGEARRLAGHHDHHVARVAVPADSDGSLRHALEIRHPSFVCPEFIELLRAHDIALVVADTAGKWPKLWDVTAGFVYVRLHGDAALYVSGYSAPALDRWAEDVGRWRSGGAVEATRRLASAPSRTTRDVFVYFDNDVKVQAPFDAMSLARRFGQGPESRVPPVAAEIREVPRSSWAGWVGRGVSRRTRTPPSPLVRRNHHQRKKKT